MAKKIVHDHNGDGVDRRGFLECMAWAGTGVLWSIGSGVLSSQAFGQKMKMPKGGLHFVQISDSHMGFDKPANPNVGATLQIAIDRINSLPVAPEFVIHTGDLTHSSKPEEFDTLDQMLKGVKAQQTFFVPGEHDTSSDDGKQYMERYGKNAKGRPEDAAGESASRRVRAYPAVVCLSGVGLGHRGQRPGARLS